MFFSPLSHSTSIPNVLVFFLDSSLGSHDRGSYHKTHTHTHTHSHTHTHTHTHTHKHPHPHKHTPKQALTHAQTDTHVVPIASRCLASLWRSKRGEKSRGHQNCSATFFIILHFFQKMKRKLLKTSNDMFFSYSQIKRFKQLVYRKTLRRHGKKNLIVKCKKIDFSPQYFPRFGWKQC